jgi:hypothetical protein
VELLAAANSLDSRAQLVAIIGSALLFVFLLELLRRRRLAEPYAILWLLASIVLLVLSIWNDLLDEVADAVGIRTPANALFAVAFGFILALLLSFSVVLSRLSRENKILAQELARLNEAEPQAQSQAREAAPARQESPTAK